LAWLPSLSLEEKTPVWFPERPAIYSAARLAFADKSGTLPGCPVFRRFSPKAA
jgi:hypothetical protein